MKHNIIIDENLYSLEQTDDCIELRVTGLKNGSYTAMSKDQFIKFVRLVNGFDHALNGEGIMMETTTQYPETSVTPSARRKH